MWPEVLANVALAILSIAGKAHPIGGRRKKLPQRPAISIRSHLQPFGQFAGASGTCRRPGICKRAV